VEKERLANQIANFEAHAESAGKHGGKAREAVTFGRRGKVIKSFTTPGAQFLTIGINSRKPHIVELCSATRHFSNKAVIIQQFFHLCGVILQFLIKKKIMCHPWEHNTYLKFIYLVPNYLKY